MILGCAELWNSSWSVQLDVNNSQVSTANKGDTDLNIRRKIP